MASHWPRAWGQAYSGAHCLLASQPGGQCPLLVLALSFEQGRDQVRLWPKEVRRSLEWYVGPEPRELGLGRGLWSRVVVAGRWLHTGFIERVSSRKPSRNRDHARQEPIPSLRSCPGTNRRLPKLRTRDKLCQRFARWDSAFNDWSAFFRLKMAQECTRSGAPRFLLDH